MIFTISTVLFFGAILFFGHIVDVKRAEKIARENARRRVCHLVSVASRTMPDVIWTDAIYARCKR